MTTGRINQIAIVMRTNPPQINGAGRHTHTTASGLLQSLQLRSRFQSHPHRRAQKHGSTNATSGHVGRTQTARHIYMHTQARTHTRSSRSTRRPSVIRLPCQHSPSAQTDRERTHKGAVVAPPALSDTGAVRVRHQRYAAAPPKQPTPHAFAITQLPSCVVCFVPPGAAQKAAPNATCEYNTSNVRETKLPQGPTTTRRTNSATDRRRSRQDVSPTLVSINPCLRKRTSTNAPDQQPRRSKLPPGFYSPHKPSLPIPAKQRPSVVCVPEGLPTRRLIMGMPTLSST